MDNKKAIAAAIAAVISASGAAIDASFDNPADILQNTTVEPKVAYADPTIDPDDVATQDDKKEVQSVRGTFRGWILQLPMAVRALFIVPQWFIGNVIVAGGEFLFAALSPVLHVLLSFALLALVIIGAFTATAKAMFPDLPLNKILNRHTLKGLLITSVGVFSADQVLSMFWSDYAQIKIFGTAGLTLIGLSIVVGLFARREHKRRTKEAIAEKARGSKENKPEELIVHSLGETFVVRLREQKQNGAEAE